MAIRDDALEDLLMRRTELRDYHNHKENVIYASLALSIASVPAISAVWTSDETALHTKTAISLLSILAVIANNFFLLNQIKNKKIAMKRVEIYDTAIRHLISAPTEVDLTQRLPVLPRANDCTLKRALGAGYDDVRTALEKADDYAFVSFIAEQNLKPPEEKDSSENKHKPLFSPSPIIFANAAVLFAQIILPVLQTINCEWSYWLQ